ARTSILDALTLYNRLHQFILGAAPAHGGNDGTNFLGERAVDRVQTINAMWSGSVGTFDDRRRGFEEKFRVDQEFCFRLNVRRNRLFGKWAAAALGLSGSEAGEYAKSVMSAALQAPRDEDIITKVEQDFSAKSITKTRAQLREVLDQFAEQARAQ